MNAQAAAAQKLAMKLGDSELASALVTGGFDNPAKIRAATDRELRAIRGIGKASVDKIREKLPHKG